jgi:serine/threonine protein kinase
MLTGRFPFEGNDEQVRAAHFTRREAPPVAAHAAGVPRDLAAVIDRCLERKPRRRWDTAAELRQALQRCRPQRRTVWQRLVRSVRGSIA